MMVERFTRRSLIAGLGTLSALVLGAQAFCQASATDTADELYELDGWLLSRADLEIVANIQQRTIFDP